MARIAGVCAREAGPRMRLTRRQPQRTIERLAHEVIPSPRCHGTARDFVLLPKHGETKGGGTGRVRGGKQPEPSVGGWAGGGRAWEMLVRGGSSAGALPRSRASEPLRLYIGHSARAVR
jgi:hypothetical protein